MRRVHILLLSAAFCLSGCGFFTPTPEFENAAQINAQSKTTPDWHGTVIPPNIAPLNFKIEQPGDTYFARITFAGGEDIRVSSATPVIQIPIQKWKTCLHNNAGSSFQISVFVLTEKKWQQYNDIVINIAKEPIDNYLAYRLIKPLYVYWDKMGLYQRDLTSFREEPVFLNKTSNNNCVNCHSFHNRQPDKMLFHMRAGKPGTAMMLVDNGEIRKINTATSFNPAVAYRSWHPNGELIAFSANTVRQFFHAVGENRDVYDKASDIMLYNLKENTISTSPAIASTERMETYPEWSPDGKTLFFCSTPALENYDEFEHPYKKIKYDLDCIDYNPDSNSWGAVRRLISATESGLSITHPKISPDGRYVLFCMSGYGNFTIYKPDADLYVYDLHNKTMRKLDSVNSDKSESYHCWSSNGRWIVFSSKRDDGLCARPYFSYMNENGEFSKPFVLPQKNPALYEKFAKTFNVPEFMTGRITTRPQQLARAAWQKTESVKLDYDGVPQQDEHSAEEEMWQPVQR